MERRSFIKTATLGAGVAALSSPNVFASSSKKYKWKMVTTWPKNFPGLGTGANNLAKYITKMSGGRIKVKVYGAGELIPALGIFDAVSEGIAEMGHGAAYYWKGKSQASQFFAAVPFGLNNLEMSSWIRYGGGQKLWDNLYAKFNLKPFITGNTGVQMGGWFNKQIRSVNDFKGLKMRMPGLGGEVIKNVGATPVLLAGGEIFQALQTGTIDATEWVGPYNDLAFGFYQIAKYYYYPGWHEPGTVLEAFVNKKAYDKLPQDLQEIVSKACEAAYLNMSDDFTNNNNAALQTLIKKYNVKLKKFPRSVLKKLENVSMDVVSDLAKNDRDSRIVYDSFSKFRTQAIDWNKVGELSYAKARLL